jgi:squalene-associated FAD-dependent desaturase
VDNGQHVLLGCYRDTLSFLSDIGALDNVHRQTQLTVTMIDRAGRRSRLMCPSLPSPFHLMAGVMDWEALAWSDRFSVLRMAGPLRIARRQMRSDFSRRTLPGASQPKIAASPGETVESWLIRNGQSARLREMLWTPLALAALNQPPSKAAAPAFARVLAEMFGADPQAASILIPSKPLDVMYAGPAQRFIESRGGLVQPGTPVVIRLDGAEIGSISAAGRLISARAVISAVPWFSLAELFQGDREALQEILDRAQAISSSPILTVNLWFDREVMDETFIGLPGRSMQWVFDKRTAFGGAASHLSMVSSGASPLLERTNPELIEEARAELSAALPRARSANLLRGTVIREPRATFSLAPGQPTRPGVVTPVRGLYLAGDWIDTGLPATIESAVRSGHGAALAALSNLR